MNFKYYNSYKAWLRYIKYHLHGCHPIGVKQSVYKKSDIYNKPCLTADMVDHLTDLVLNHVDGWFEECKSAMENYNFLKSDRKPNLVVFGKHEKLGYIYDLMHDPQDDFAYGRLMYLHGVPCVNWPVDPAQLECLKGTN
jgi:hypothetical protein